MHSLATKSVSAVPLLSAAATIKVLIRGGSCWIAGDAGVHLGKEKPLQGM